MACAPVGAKGSDDDDDNGDDDVFPVGMPGELL